jgi:hypothetical protein
LSKKKYLGNLKSALKIFGMFCVIFSLILLVDGLEDGDYSDFILIPIVFSFLPAVVLEAAIYTQLNVSSLSKFVCVIIFSFVGTAIVLTIYVIGNYVEVGVIDINSVQRMAILFFIIHVVGFFQLSWNESNDA